MNVRMDGKVAIVTGAGSGIGAASAIRLARDGAKVVVADINIKSAEHTVEVIKDAGGQAMATAFDLADADSIERMVNGVHKELGRLDVMVNNAAAMHLMVAEKSIHEAQVDVFQQVFAANVSGTAMACKHALNLMRPQGSGSIINLSSVGGISSDATCPAYAASKAAISSLTSWIATNYGRDGIRCNAIAPGLILTPMVLEFLSSAQRDMIQRHTPSTRLGKPEDIAGAVAYLASDDAFFVNGAILVVDGGLTIHQPYWADVIDLQASQK